MLLTTNYLDEATALCDRVAIIDHGAAHRVRATRRAAARRRGDRRAHAARRTFPRRRPCCGLRPDVAEVVEVDHSVRARLVHENAAAAVIAAAGAVTTITGVRVTEPSLEDIFLTLTGRELRE